ncbi:hypothetical protein ADK65_33060 [Streptomyces sp. NRRL B-1140]|uniref:hypothetical protein n=1 Tax=Streptomyces sp. NRRL B-1140 TaxID=1415549 RepID=UPI0006B022CF|nr:hypothetical protein [Streptomyces sp. NRRL B-1140]KOV93323.1 hypothetical protein ADK65_33060 [Streptomyces sp. NRRL B-1140]
MVTEVASPTKINIKNPSFADPHVDPGDSRKYYTGDSVGGWKVTHGTVELLGSRLADHPDGTSQSMALEGDHDSRGAVAQDIVTTPGQEVTLTWEDAPEQDKSNTDDYAGTVQKYKVRITSGPNIVEEIYTPADGRLPTHVWTSRSLAFTAAAATSTLEFISLAENDPAKKLDVGAMITHVAGTEGTAVKKDDDKKKVDDHKVDDHKVDDHKGDDQKIDGVADEHALAIFQVTDLTPQVKVGDENPWPPQYICVAITSADEQPVSIKKLVQEFHAPEGLEFTGAAGYAYFERLSQFGSVPPTPLSCRLVNATTLVVEDDLSVYTKDDDRPFLGYGLMVRAAKGATPGTRYGHATFGKHHKPVKLTGTVLPK